MSNSKVSCKVKLDKYKSLLHYDRIKTQIVRKKTSLSEFIAPVAGKTLYNTNN